MPAPREDAATRRARIAQELAELEREGQEDGTPEEHGQSALAQEDVSGHAATATTERRPRHALAPIYPSGWQHYVPSTQPRRAPEDA